MQADTSLPEILDPWRERIHPAALMFPRPSAEEYSDLKTSIEKNGLLVPVFVYFDGQQEWLLDGLSRFQVLLELGYDVLEEDQRGNPRFSTQHTRMRGGIDPYRVAYQLNYTRRHLTTDQKQRALSQVLRHCPDIAKLSDRAIAKEMKVSDQTVAAARRIEVAMRGDLALNDRNEVKSQTVAAARRIEVAMRGDLALNDRNEVKSQLRLETSGKQARGRKPGARPLAKPPPSIAPRRCPHCGAPIDNEGRFRR